MTEFFKEGFAPLGEDESLMAPSDFTYLHTRGNSASISIDEFAPWLAELVDRSAAMGGEVVFREVAAQAVMVDDVWKILIDCSPFGARAIQSNLEEFLLDIIHDDLFDAEMRGYSCLLRRVADAVDAAADKVSRVTKS